MVTYSDGATLAQMSNPDMRLCIAYALTYPERINDPFGEIDWSQIINLNFEPFAQASIMLFLEKLPQV